MSDPEPELVEVRAIDIVPYEAAIWCSIENGKPFANTIEHRGWSEDGEHIFFVLGTHNFYKAKPDDLVRVVQLPRGARLSSSLYAEQFDNEAFMSKRPKQEAAIPCAHCGGPRAMLAGEGRSNGTR